MSILEGIIWGIIVGVAMGLLINRWKDKKHGIDLYKAHADLVDKKFRVGLTLEEQQKLEQIREQIEGPEIYQKIQEAFKTTEKDGEK